MGTIAARIAPLLLDALRIAAFVRQPEDRPATSWPRIVAAALLSASPAVVYSLVTVGFEGTFDGGGAPGMMFHVLVVALGAIAFASLIRRPEATAQILLAGLLAYFVIDIPYWALYGLTHGVSPSLAERTLHYPFTYVPLAWLALAMGRFAISRVGIEDQRQGWVLVAGAVLVVAPLGMIYRDTSVWREDYARKYAETQESAPRYQPASEDVLYSQPKILERELAGLQPGRKGLVDVFFIGMAGHGSQDVFMREIDSVAKIMSERFDAEGRIVKLVNNPKTTMTSPIASVTSLRAALTRVSGAMDVEEDVLVLFLTSHGSNTHRFSLELWPFKFKELTPAVLRDALDASGIRNRVVIVSACYSGGFIEKLKDERTLVISAAAPDKNSFGCSNEAEWTYFGRAYFDEALRKTLSFTEALEMAKPVIAEREKKDKYEPSNPQAAVGAQIARKLAALEAELPLRTHATASAAPQPVADRADVVSRYLDLTFEPEFAREYFKSCRHNMHQSGPGKTLERAPDTFGGMNKSSEQWPRLEAAWDRYSEAYCLQANDPAVLRSMYERHVRELLQPRELQPVVAFLETEKGRNWLSKEREALRRQAADLGALYRKLGDTGYTAYLAEMEKIKADYLKRARR